VALGIRGRGSKLTTHARCHFSETEADAIFDRFAADPYLSEAKLAAQLGVTTGVVRSTLMVVRKRRGLKVGQWGSGTAKQTPTGRADASRR
jgi:hypothetical protein